MLRIKKLYEAIPGTDISFRDRTEPKRRIALRDIVRYAGYEWYVIGLANETAILLAKNNDFGTMAFDEDTNDYRISQVRRYLLQRIAPSLERRKGLLVPYHLADIGMDEDIWLLSEDEARTLPQDIRKFSKWWWLRSQGQNDRYEACVRTDGEILKKGSDIRTGYNAVRPAICVLTSDIL